MTTGDNSDDPFGGERIQAMTQADYARRPSGRESPDLTKAKTDTEIYRARLAQIEYEERVGKLLPVQDVRRAMEKCAGVIMRGPAAE